MIGCKKGRESSRKGSGAEQEKNNRVENGGDDDTLLSLSFSRIEKRKREGKNERKKEAEGKKRLGRRGIFALVFLSLFST